MAKKLSPYGALVQWASEDPGRILIENEEQRITYSDFYSYVRRLQGQLRSLRIAEGTPLAIAASEAWETFVACSACWAVGATAVLLPESTHWKAIFDAFGFPLLIVGNAETKHEFMQERLRILVKAEAPTKNIAFTPSEGESHVVLFQKNSPTVGIVLKAQSLFETVARQVSPITVKAPMHSLSSLTSFLSALPAGGSIRVNSAATSLRAATSGHFQVRRIDGSATRANERGALHLRAQNLFEGYWKSEKVFEPTEAEFLALDETGYSDEHGTIWIEA